MFSSHVSPCKVTSRCQSLIPRNEPYLYLDVFTAVQSSSATYGVVPFENSTNGSVVYTLDLFADRLRQFSDVFVCGEAFLDVHHYLLGHTTGSQHEDRTVSGDSTPTTKTPMPLKPKTHPVTDLKHVKRIYSHPQAFGQCEAFLSAYLKGVERLELSSTSKAAEIVSQDTTKCAAAISSRLAANVHNLDVLAKGIEDRDDNTTRFFFLCRGSDLADSIEAVPFKGGGSKLSWKTLITFTINHQSAGALADALLVFKTYELNLTSINSRPSRIRPWHYIFFVEFEGRREAGGRGAVNEAFERLKAITEGCRWHGSWRNRGMSSYRLTLS